MNDTIVAISTALGIGAISIVRMSGPDAIKIVNSIFKGKNLEEADSHTINYGHIVYNGETIDEVLVSIMKSPKTYTMEDIVEINCHGGIATTNKVLEILLKKGARLAEAGEFTKRAFLNGRIDLTKAEAVMDLIESKTDTTRRIFINQLEGKTSTLIDSFRNQLKELIASIEVNIDYPEYQDIEQITVKAIKKRIKELKKELASIIQESKEMGRIKNGIDTLIIGRPNVGKSSILNKFLEYEKAIVTDIAGTTRDIVEGEVILDNIPINIIDTAGIRTTEDIIEKKGVEKSLSLIEDADLVIVVLDSSEKLTKEDEKILEKAKEKPLIVVLNKNDLNIKIEKDKLKDYNIVSTNTKDIDGIRPLKEKIKELFNLEKISQKDYTYLSNIRQVTKAEEVLDLLSKIEEDIKNRTPIDLLEISLREAFDLLGEIIGKTYTDEIIDHLFENFCVGK